MYDLCRHIELHISVMKLTTRLEIVENAVCRHVPLTKSTGYKIISKQDYRQSPTPPIDSIHNLWTLTSTNGHQNDHKQIEIHPSKDFTKKHESQLITAT
jgi:hypothetical protein